MLLGMAKLFTVIEANELLPRLRPILEELRRLVEQAEQLEAEVGTAESRLRTNGHSVPSGPYQRREAARSAIAQQIAQVHELGVELKDPRTGLIDFPHQRDGRVVYLCWKLDEGDIAYWHPIETGFPGRQPL
jgi:hypothetical protein